MAAVRPLPPTQPSSGLAIGYERIAASAALERPGALAAIGFAPAGDPWQEPDAGDPRLIRVPLRPLSGDQGRSEIWRVAGPVERGRDGDLAWAHGGGFLLLALTTREDAHGGPRGAAVYAYQQVMAGLRRHGYPHLLRAWNYLADINLGDGDEERYRRFSIGRAEGIADLAAAGFPAATAIGRRDGESTLLVYALAAREPGRAIENPRQLSAYRYPRCYGPVPPSFARAMHVPTQPPSLLISGTASVVGHASVHDEVESQAQETLRNLDALVQAAGLGERLSAQGGCLKVYLRHADDAASVAELLQQAGIARQHMLLLHGDICRTELLLEIDGVVRPPAGS